MTPERIDDALPLLKTKLCKGPCCRRVNTGGRERWIGLFGTNRGRKDGADQYCRECRREVNRGAYEPRRTGRAFRRPRTW